jgi:hypothetical protein
LLEGLVARALNPKALAEYQAELSCPPLPIALDYLWRIYHRLRRRKGGNGFGSSPIEWPDIDAFLRQARIRLDPWEIGVLEDLDDLYLSDHTKSQLETE